MKNRSGTIIFEQRPRIVSYASVVGKKEGEGPLRDDFDRIIPDSHIGKDTFEQGESALMRMAIDIALAKSGQEAEDIGVMFCGDLLNQCIASSFAARGMPVPYSGIYGACSTMALGLILSAITVEGGAADRALCAASSHFCTAERQYRTPLEYGAQRPPTSQWTVTGAGACVVGTDAPVGNPGSTQRDTAVGGESEQVREQLSAPAAPYIHSAQIGIINDMGITDQNNMGAAMAPAVVKLGTKNPVISGQWLVILVHIYWLLAYVSLRGSPNEPWRSSFEKNSYI